MWCKSRDRNESECAMADPTEALSESAKAVQEVAKAAGNAIDAGRKAGGWLDRIFGGGIEDAVGLHWSDRIRARRIEAAIYDWARLESLLHKVAARLQAKGIVATRVVTPKVALPLLECATVEYDDDLHTLWANLLASGLDPSARQIEKKYISTLAELTSADAAVFAAICVDWETTNRHADYEHPTLKFEPSVDGTHSHSEISVITLNRLGLIAPAFTEFNTYDPADAYDWKASRDPLREPLRVYGDFAFVTVTAFGDTFHKATIA